MDDAYMVLVGIVRKSPNIKITRDAMIDQIKIAGLFITPMLLVVLLASMTSGGNAVGSEPVYGLHYSTVDVEGVNTAVRLFSR